MTTFSNFSSPAESEFIKHLFSLVFNVKEYDEIFNAYNVFADDFTFERSPKKMETVQRNILQLKDSDDILKSKHNDSQYQIGIDLPVILNKGNTSDTVFIVSEDPLRRDFHNDIILGIPFGIHIKKNRDGRLKVYWEVIENILAKNKQVYITDLYKFWMKDKKKKTKEKYSKEVFSNFKEALKYEISELKPELILTFGKPAATALNLIEWPSSQKIASFPHPSGSANSEWKKVFATNQNNEFKTCSALNKIDYLNKEIGKYFA